MKIIRHPRLLASNDRGLVAALGNFDGFHHGHQAVVGEAGRLARDMGVPLAVVTTEPHPRSFFRPNDSPFRLTPFRERAWLLEQFGVDILISLPFDRDMSRRAAQDFVLDILCRDLGVLHLVTGFDYRFGKGRGGGIHVLAWMGAMEGFGLNVVDPVLTDDTGNEQVYSSSLVRDVLRAGDVRRAAALLGHWWAISGRIRHGDKRGRTIGFPTANFTLGDCLRPKFGVYAVRMTLEGSSCVHEGVANVGRRPTFDKSDVLLEVHLFDFDGDLYGRHARVELVDFIRPEQAFSGIDALKAQIGRDSDEARRRLSRPDNTRPLFSAPRLDDYLARHPRPLSSSR